MPSILDELKASLTQLQAATNTLLDGLSRHRPAQPPAGREILVSVHDLQGLTKIITDLHQAVSAVALRLSADGWGEPVTTTPKGVPADAREAEPEDTPRPSQAPQPQVRPRSSPTSR